MQKSRKKTETHAEKVARLTKLSQQSKASGYIRCKSYAEFAKAVGLRQTYSL